MTKIQFLLCVLLCILLPSGLEAQERYLQGQLQRIGEYDEWLDEVGIDVTIVEANTAGRTREGGMFRIFLPDGFEAGKQVTLKVKKTGWKILSPAEGEVRIPRDLELESVTVRLLPVDSELFWTHNRLKKFIEDLSETAKEQVTPDGKPEDIDFSLAIRDWAKEYGFSAQEAREEIDKWIAQVEEDHDNEYELGLAAFARKNFDKAAEHFGNYTDHKIKQLEAVERKAAEFRKKEEQIKSDIIRGFRKAGDAHYSNYQFGEALAQYERALDYVPKAESPELWGAILYDIGKANVEIGIRTKGIAVESHLNAAIEVFRKALAVCTRDQMPQQWAETQNGLGNALSMQGVRTGGEEGSQLLAQAAAAYQNALVVYTQAQLPQQWAMTQNNLGAALQAQGIRTGGAEGTQLLAQAVAAYQNALKVRTYEHLPVDWARTQYNLAETYFVLQDWHNAAACYSNFLKVYPDNKTVAWIYHERLFQFSEAFALGQKRLEQYPEDLAARCSFAEKHFTTSRFHECEKQIAALLASPDVEPGLKIVLRIIEIPNLLALGKAETATFRLDTLIEAVASQSEDFKVGWTFEGAKHFISQTEELGTYRDWLMDLFRAVENEDRDATLTALREVRADFHAGAAESR